MKEFILWIGLKGTSYVSIKAERYILTENDLSFWIDTTLVFHTMLYNISEFTEIERKKSSLTYKHIYKKGEKNEELHNDI